MLFFLILFLTSCKKNDENLDSKILNEKSQNSPNVEIENDSLQKATALKINYLEHKNLLDILTILPDSSMASWSWEKSERLEFVKHIQKNNYTTGSPSHFSHFKLIQPNTIEIQVVDGHWILSIYKVQSDNYIVITDDIVGDGNDLMAFEYLNGELKSIPFQNIFDTPLNALIIDQTNDECLESFKDNYIGFEYDFIGTQKIKIVNSLFEKSNQCFKGNTLNYEFNPTAKKFKLISIQ